MKVYGGHGYKAPCIHNLGIRWLSLRTGHLCLPLQKLGWLGLRDVLNVMIRTCNAPTVNRTPSFTSQFVSLLRNVATFPMT